MTTPTTPDPSTFIARTQTDLVAIVPLVLGFHPRDSVVLLTFGGPGSGFHARVDLPVGVDEQQEVAGVLLDAARANGVRRAAVLLFTDDVGVAESQGMLLAALLVSVGVEVLDVLRVDDGEWHPVPDTGEPGTAYELETHRFTAQRVFQGQVVHRDRGELADSLIGTDDDDAVEVALAATRFADLAARWDLAEEPTHSLLRDEARWLQRCVRARLTDRSRPSVADAGRLLVLASLAPTREVAWAEIDRKTSGAHVDLWRDLVRRSPRELLPGVSSLLAFAAWQHGDGALAWCAVDRCLEVDPDHPMAHCVAELLTQAVPPNIWEQVKEDDLAVFRRGGRSLAVSGDEPGDRAC